MIKKHQEYLGTLVMRFVTLLFKSEDVGGFGKVYNIAVEAGPTDDEIVNADGSAHTLMKLLRD